MRRCLGLLILMMIGMVATQPLKAQQLDLERLFEERNLGPVEELLSKGNYELCARICEAAIARGQKSAAWRLMRLKALIAMGQEAEALKESEAMLKGFPNHLELLMVRYEIACNLGRKDVMKASLEAVNAAARALPAKDRSAQDWVALGKAALELGADAQKVIQQYFNVAQKKDPKAEAPYLAEGDLALEKDNATRAAEVFRAGLKAHGETANLRAGLARAFANSDREKQEENITRALELNPLHEQTLLARAEMLIGAEKFLDAEGAIQKVLGVRENCPQAWALRAAVAQLSAADANRVKDARAKGLRRWAQNPEVDHILGRVLSRAYRFTEGAGHQREALKMDPEYLPAKVQLCHDLLRLGDEAEAWKLAASVREHDGYNIQAHNIGLLEQEMNGYVTKAFDDFILKMPKRDWPIYGEQALALLREAKGTLCPKYGMQLQRPVMVEFFGSQQDFAIRTFGSLGGQGLLGVCFGTVITMNSPGSLAHGRNNWESTLWHEYCHVVTLTATQNRMPRWLSEGISVYEEGQRHPAWGMKMNEPFRRMILDEKAITSVSQLSGAFLNAKSEEHLMFAYYQSSQVVGYLLEHFGPEKFQAILRDLASGKRVNEAITAQTEPMERLEKDFENYLRDKAAKEFGALADWKEPEPERVNPSDAASFAGYFKKHPNSLWALRKQAADEMEHQHWTEVLALAERLIALVPEDVSGESGLQMKATALRKLERTDEEIAVLRQIAERNSSAMAVFLRLLEVDVPAQRWPLVEENARRAIALNPFLRTPHQALAEASETQGRKPEALAEYERVLILDPAQSVMIHFRMAKLLREQDGLAAKHHLLDALAEAPRFQEGLTLLREWK